MYLRQELEVLPKDWPLIGVGREAYKALAYLDPDRTLIGVPHPMGAYGHFRWLFEKQWQLRAEFEREARHLLDKRPGESVWLHTDNVAEPFPGHVPV